MTGQGALQGLGGHVEICRNCSRAYPIMPRRENYSPNVENDIVAPETSVDDHLLSTGLSALWTSSLTRTARGRKDWAMEP